MSQKEHWHRVRDALERAESELAEAVGSLDEDNDVVRQLDHLRSRISESLSRVNGKIESFDPPPSSSPDSLVQEPDPLEGLHISDYNDKTEAVTIEVHRYLLKHPALREALGRRAVEIIAGGPSVRKVIIDRRD